jgi:hypothetical protein
MEFSRMSFTFNHAATVAMPAAKPFADFAKAVPCAFVWNWVSTTW